MIYTEQTKNAMRIAYEAHKDGFDKSGIPYIFHPTHIAEQMDNETACSAALLHDVVEDTGLTFEDLKNKGVSDKALDIIRILTHDDSSEEYMAYIHRIKDSGNADALKIKLADLKHNSDVTRLGKVEPKLLDRIERYKAAYELLLSQ